MEKHEMGFIRIWGGKLSLRQGYNSCTQTHKREQEVCFICSAEWTDIL